MILFFTNKFHVLIVVIDHQSNACESFLNIYIYILNIYIYIYISFATFHKTFHKQVSCNVTSAVLRFPYTDSNSICYFLKKIFKEFINVLQHFAIPGKN